MSIIKQWHHEGELIVEVYSVTVDTTEYFMVDILDDTLAKYSGAYEHWRVALDVGQAMFNSYLRRT